MEEAGYTFDVIAADVDEEAIALDLPPRDVPLVLARAKAFAVSASLGGEPAVLLAADTVAYTAAGEPLGKPADREDAARMLRKLFGTVHHVATGYVCHRVDTGDTIAGKVRSDVTMREVGEDELARFLDTGDWEGKAGAYGIQDEPGAAAGSDPFVESINGELTNIIGLPMPQVVDSLARLGVHPRLP